MRLSPKFFEGNKNNKIQTEGMFISLVCFDRIFIIIIIILKTIITT